MREAWHQARELERVGGVHPTIVGGAGDDDLGFDRSSSLPPSMPLDDQSGVRALAELRLQNDGALSPEAHAIARQLAGVGRTTSAMPAIVQSVQTPEATAATETTEQ